MSCARFGIDSIGKGFCFYFVWNKIKIYIIGCVSFGWCTHAEFIGRWERERENERRERERVCVLCAIGRAIDDYTVISLGWEKRNENLYWMSCTGTMKIAIDIALGWGLSFLLMSLSLCIFFSPSIPLFYSLDVDVSIFASIVCFVNKCVCMCSILDL